MSRICSICGEDEKCTQNFSSKILREETTFEPRDRWKDNIKMHLKEILWENMG
jgi:hypothetical protein